MSAVRKEINTRETVDAGVRAWADDFDHWLDTPEGLAYLEEQAYREVCKRLLRFTYPDENEFLFI